MSAAVPDTTQHPAPQDAYKTAGVFIWRFIAWAIVATTFTFLVNNYLSNWRDWPGASVTGNPVWLGLVQIAIYAGGLAFSWFTAKRRHGLCLRTDADQIYAITAFFIRACFWIVILVGIVDMVISFLRVEGLLAGLVGEELTKQLGRPQYRGTYVHLPLIALAIVIALVTRTLGFIWLALLVVLAELQIVIGRFILSYEQAFMGDIVRFWYGALFLFASAYTLTEEGHVRVDVFYANLSQRTRGLINAVGSIVLGMSLCIVIIAVGMGSKTSIINSALLNFEVSQSGFGMYIKYLMAGFLGVFAISMNVQFAGYLLNGIADWRADPGGRPTTDIAH